LKIVRSPEQGRVASVGLDMVHDIRQAATANAERVPGSIGTRCRLPSTCLI